MSRFIETLSRSLASLSLNAEGQFVVALSGGLDSTVLLHCLAQLYPERTRAVHINHGLSEYADQWSQACQQVCSGLIIPFDTCSIQLHTRPGESLEEIARISRYRELMRFVGPNDILLTAHNQDDQAETMLMQLLRGAGPKGLAAMPWVAKFGEGRHARPLLDVSRAVLVHYANQHGLRWVEDESNQNQRFDRNYVRHQLMPLIRVRWPGANKTISRSARHCADAAVLLEETAERELERVQDVTDGSLLLDTLQDLPKAAQHRVFRLWVEQHGCTLPTTAQVEALSEQMISASPDRQPHVPLGDVDVRRYRGKLFLQRPLSVHEASVVLEWDLQTDSELVLPSSLGVLRRDQLSSDVLPARVQVRFRQGGERGKLVGRKGRRSLKSLFQEWGVPAWRRDRIPLLYHGDQLIEVVGYAAFEQPDISVTE